MKAGINALYLIPGKVGGTEIYLRSLLDAIVRLDTPHDFYLFTNRETGTDLGPTHPRIHVCPQPVSAESRPARILWEQFRLPRAVKGLDVLFNPGFTAPRWCGIPCVTVFHDLQHVRHPEFFRWWDLPFWNLLLTSSARRSKLLIAVSENTRRDVISHYRLPPDRIRTIPHGVDEQLFTLSRDRVDSRLLLCVSTLHPHKNLDRLMRVFARLRAESPDCRLVIAGMKGHHATHLEDLRQRLGLSGAVEFTGWISRAALYRLYGEAAAFVFPSRFEGFGMPVVEALASGIPTACSSAEPMRSIAGPAAVQFDPESDEQMLEALKKVLFDAPARAHLKEAGPMRARDFTWRRSARLTVQALEDVCA